MHRRKHGEKAREGSQHAREGSQHAREGSQHKSAHKTRRKGVSPANPSARLNAAFVHLQGIHTLYMHCCHQATITGEDIAQLRRVQILCTD